MKNKWIVKAGLTSGAALAAFVLLLQQDPEEPIDGTPEGAIDREEMRVQAARESLDARPSIGEAHLPPFDAKKAVVREETELRRLSALAPASR